MGIISFQLAEAWLPEVACTVMAVITFSKYSTILVWSNRHLLRVRFGSGLVLKAPGSFFDFSATLTYTNTRQTKETPRH